MHDFLSQKRVLSLPFSLSLFQFFDEFFIYSSIYAILLIFGNPLFSYSFFFFFFFYIRIIMLIFSLNLIGQFAGIQKKVLSLFLSQFFNEFFYTFFYLCQITNLWELFIIIIILSFFFYTRIIMLIFSLNLIGQFARIQVKPNNKEFYGIGECLNIYQPKVESEQISGAMIKLQTRLMVLPMFFNQHPYFYFSIYVSQNQYYSLSYFLYYILGKPRVVIFSPYWLMPFRFVF